MGMETEVKQHAGARFKVKQSCFRTKTAYHPEYADVVVVHCSDGRFSVCREEFILGYLREPYADELVLPGGVGVLHTLSAHSWSEVEVARAKLIFLVQSHHSTRVVLFAHEGCGHYAKKYPGRPPEQIRDIQLSDLATVVRDLRSRLHGVEITAFYNRPADGRLVFDEIIPD